MVTVIISIYNTAKYLSQCIHSVLSQDIEDKEIILVNDNSTDNSLEICQELGKKHGEIRILNLTSNIGLAKNRFEGLKIARGDYIMFLDSDDWLEGRDTLSTMLKEAIYTDSDYVEILSRRVLDSRGWIKNKTVPHTTGIIESPKLFNDYYISFFGVNILNVNVWGKLYRRSSIEKACIKPWKYAMGEDLYFNLQLFPHVKKISIIDKIGHNYRYGGMTTHYNPQLFPSLLALYKIKKEYIKKYNYNKAITPSIIEIKNVLLSDIMQAIRFINDKNQILGLVEERLSMDVWDDLSLLKNLPKFWEDHIIKAIYNKDKIYILEHCIKTENKNKLYYNIKRIGAKVLSLI